ncbi:YopX family protein [Metabacillus sp. GX 13764]|uniref:YopX family protein n=1 Tax=Metabacillus kandeliae TaxID=2900151 RepID=UPI001E29A573|nr:YopX family protein [Metabacillus kandeliae]MCD7034336.1 YopX family protein [Metabacillus kandeliae]
MLLRFRFYDHEITESMIYQEENMRTDLIWHKWETTPKCSPMMQFVGLEDVNAKMIFTGDILKLKIVDYSKTDYMNGPDTIYKNKLSVVEHWKSSSNIGYRIRDIKGKTMMIKPSSLQTMEAEVVGNIYENPELLDPVHV